MGISLSIDSTPSRLDRRAGSISRTFVLLSLVAATAFGVQLSTAGWQALPLASGAAFLLSYAAARRWPHWTLGLLSALAYVVPVILLFTAGRYWIGFVFWWIAALLGAAAAAPWGSDWAFPPRFRAPLVLWALVLAVSWPMVALREADFSPSLLVGAGRWLYPRLANTHVGVPPYYVAIGVVEGTITAGAGLLWIDALFRWFSDAPPGRFARCVLAPMAVVAGLAALVGAYQSFADVTWLNPTIFARLNRATGLSVDANVFGMTSAMWAMGFLALAATATGKRRTALVAVMPLMAAGVWLSGSRISTFALGLGLLWLLATEFGEGSQRLRRNVGAGALAVAALIVALMSFAPDVGPVQRFFSQVPTLDAGVLGIVTELFWHRAGHGTAAVQMVAEHPVTGIGVGTFNILVVDYLRPLGFRPDSDNALNWFRHELAELGVLGSLGWIWWVGLFAAGLLRTRGDGQWRVPAAAIKALLVGFAAASLLGMPGQNAAVILTFWIFAFWYLQAVPRGWLATPAWPFRSPRAAWTIVCVVVGCHAVATLATGFGTLRPAQRAQRFGWDYHYGLYEREGTAGQTFRWTRQEAVLVVPVGADPLILETWTDDPGAVDDPIELKVWVDGDLRVDTTLVTGQRVSADLQVKDVDRAVVRTWVSRTWRPADHGANDSRELGVALAGWSMVREGAPPTP